MSDIMAMLPLHVSGSSVIKFVDILDNYPLGICRGCSRLADLRFAALFLWHMSHVRLYS